MGILLGEGVHYDHLSTLNCWDATSIQGSNTEGTGPQEAQYEEWFRLRCWYKILENT